MGHNVLHDFIASRRDYLYGPLSVETDILRFLVSCFPQGIAAADSRGWTPYAMLNPDHSYARRLASADECGPT